LKTFVGLFLISAGFGAAIWIAYYFVAHEESVGTTMLAFLTGALAFAAGYAIRAERNAQLEGDDRALSPEECAGEEVGIFTQNSAYPILAAASTLLALTGLLWSPLLCGFGVVALGLALWRMGAESARV
jgi:hypothetical protein